MSARKRNWRLRKRTAKPTPKQQVHASASATQQWEESERSFTLVVHDASFSAETVVVHPEHFPAVKPNDVLRITPLHADGSPAFPDKNLVVVVRSTGSVKAKLAISVLAPVADALGLAKGMTVRVAPVVDASTVALDLVEVSFKATLPRSEMWRFKEAVVGRCVYRGLPLTAASVRVLASNLRVEGSKPAVCGLVTPRTRFSFRSRCSNVIIMVQLSREMWEFAADGCLYFERAQAFLAELFTRWAAAAVSHNVTIVFFTRVYFSAPVPAPLTARRPPPQPHMAPTVFSIMSGGAVPPTIPDDSPSRTAATTTSLGTTSPKTESSGGAAPHAAGRSVQIGADGRVYEDFYQVVVANDASGDWGALLPAIKREFLRFPERAGLGVVRRPVASSWCPMAAVGGVVEEEGVPSLSSEGNFLEAINLALNQYALAYVDRDSRHVGSQIMAITAGGGLFEVDPKVARVTNRRMTDNGSACDLVCVAPKPIHHTPMFMFPAEDDVGGDDDAFGDDPPSPIVPGAMPSLSLRRRRPGSPRGAAPRSPGDRGGGGAAAASDFVGDKGILYRSPHWLQTAFYEGGGLDAGGGATNDPLLRWLEEVATGEDAAGGCHCPCHRVASAAPAAPSGGLEYEGHHKAKSTGFCTLCGRMSRPSVFQPMTYATLFARRNYRMSRAGGAFPAALLALLRAAGRAPKPPPSHSLVSASPALPPAEPPPAPAAIAQLCFMLPAPLDHVGSQRQLVPASPQLGAAGGVVFGDDDASSVAGWSVTGGESGAPETPVLRATQVGIMGSDDFGYMVVEGDPGGVGLSLNPQLAHGVPTNAQLQPWNRLFSHLSSAADAVPAVADLKHSRSFGGSTSLASIPYLDSDTDDPVAWAPSMSEVALKEAYRHHDVAVFAMPTVVAVEAPLGVMDRTAGVPAAAPPPAAPASVRHKRSGASASRRRLSGDAVRTRMTPVLPPRGEDPPRPPLSPRRRSQSPPAPVSARPPPSPLLLRHSKPRAPSPLSSPVLSAAAEATAATIAAMGTSPPESITRVDIAPIALATGQESVRSDSSMLSLSRRLPAAASRPPTLPLPPLRVGGGLGGGVPAGATPKDVPKLPGMLEKPAPADLWDEVGITVHPFHGIATQSEVVSDRVRWADLYESEGVPAEHAPGGSALSAASAIIQMSADTDANIAAVVGTRDINWKLLTEPAVLPVTTTYFPPPAELQFMYTSGSYTVALSGTEDDMEAVKSLVARRLDQSFQIVVGESTNVKWLLGHTSIARAAGTPVYILSLGHQFHVLLLDAASSILTVVWYRRSSQTSSTSAHLHNYLVWEPVLGQALPSSRVLGGSSTGLKTGLWGEFNWNHLDQVMCSEETDLVDSIQYSRRLYLILPVVGVEDEAVGAELLRVLDTVQSRLGCRPRVGVTVTTGEDDSSTALDWTRADLRTKTGASEWLQLHVGKVYNPRRSFPVIVRWLASGMPVQDVEAQLFKAARRSESLRVVSVPSATRTTVFGTQVESQATDLSPLLNAVPLNNLLSEGVLDELSHVGAAAPTGALALFEALLVANHGYLADVGHSGTKVRDTTSALPRVAIGLHATRTGLGWYRQYIAQDGTHFFRVHDGGLLCIPATVSVGAMAGTKALRTFCTAFSCARGVVGDVVEAALQSL